MSTSATTTQVVEAVTTQRFMPLDFNVYNGSSSSGSFKNREKDLCFLGPHRKDRLFVITNRHNSLRIRPAPCVILHDGLQPQNPALGTVTNTHVEGDKKHHFWDRYSISVMSYGEDFSGLFVTETLKAVRKGVGMDARTVLRFAMDVDSAFAPDSDSMLLHTDGSRVLERQKFEWREKFTDVTGEGLEPRSEGWRLVALSEPREVLATCTPNSRSRNKALRFEFCGEGRVAGLYGASWELMAIMSGLTICHRLGEIAGSVG
ncbi:hypothetical protein Micbo1qcDRAFT_207796 [Microdochium bolleyi]|uniref:Uncharacterized protein n=1 Tax=Microdochium bolleyi TaxID=196109 RepID=A0A136IT42_9PEZI|nr:hypothetical protein Micbo1qcDRAFT_207796 [Microdochium bolleyi]